MTLFWEQGFGTTSIGELVEATGLQRGSLYGAFGDKQGLFCAALDAYMEMMLERLRAIVTAEEDPVEGVRALVRQARTDCTSPAMAGRGCLIGNTCGELSSLDLEVHERVHTFLSSVRQLIADALTDGQRRGTFSSSRDPIATAALVQCSLQGLGLLTKSTPDPSTIDRVVGEMLRILE